MAKVDGDEEELTEHDASIVRGMLKRGDKQHHIAAYFGVDSRAVSHVATSKKFPSAKIASAAELPPPGPYRVDPTYANFYRTMVRVDALWSERRLKDAKALLEASLKSPVMTPTRSDMEETADDLFRDEFGLLKDV